MKIFYGLLILLSVSSCNIKDLFQSIREESDIEEKNIEVDPINQSNDWEFIGKYIGSKEEEYDQVLSYELFLWEKDHKYKGYFYYLWYVTDTNSYEYQSIVDGKAKGKDVILKGKFDSDPVVITLHDTITPELKMSIKYPTNISATVNNVKLILDKSNYNHFPSRLNGTLAMQQFQDSMMEE